MNLYADTKKPLMHFFTGFYCIILVCSIIYNPLQYASLSHLKSIYIFKNGAVVKQRRTNKQKERSNVTLTREKAC